MGKQQKLIYLIKYFGLAVLVIAVWEYASLKGFIPPYSLPAPHKIVQTFLKLIYKFFPLNSLGRTADNHIKYYKQSYAYEK